MRMIKYLLTLFLLFSFNLATPVFANSFLSPLTDTVNSGIINTKMLTNDALKGAKVDAAVENGIAVFSGVVLSNAQISELIRIGKSVSGVHGVDVSRVSVRK